MGCNPIKIYRKEKVMKKICAILMALVILTFVGCASSGGGGGGGGASGEGYSVDLSTVKVATWTRATKKFTEPEAGVKNTIPFAVQYDGALFVLDLPDDVTSYARVTINVKCFNADGGELAPSDGNAMVVLIYDINGDLEGPEMGAGKNTPLKEFNLGGFSGQVSTERGSRVNLNQKPGGVLIQASNGGVKYIELTEITFHG